MLSRCFCVAFPALHWASVLLAVGPPGCVHLVHVCDLPRLSALAEWLALQRSCSGSGVWPPPWPSGSARRALCVDGDGTVTTVEVVRLAALAAMRPAAPHAGLRHSKYEQHRARCRWARGRQLVSAGRAGAPITYVYPPPSSVTRRVARRQRQLPILEHEPNLIAIIIACCTKISI